MASTDRNALVALFNATDGKNWKDSTNWNTDAPLGQWKGVEVNEAGRVVKLRLSYNNLRGPIPPELGKLTALVELRLGINKLSGHIPPQLGDLGALETLDLSHNNLDGHIPPQLGQLGALQSLDLADNELDGPIPSELGRLSALKTLSLYRNQLSGPIPPELGELTALTDLNLWSNQLTGHIPPQLGDLGALTRLYLYSNKLDGHIPPQLGQLGALESLILAGNELDGHIPRQLGDLGALEALDLGSNKLEGPIPPELGNLGALTWLDLSSNKLSGYIPRQLGDLGALQTLNLGSNKLDGHIPPQLGQLGALESLILAGNELDGPVPAYLVNLDKLDFLCLGDNQFRGPVPSRKQLQELRDSLVSPVYPHREKSDRTGRIGSRMPMSEDSVVEEESGIGMSTLGSSSLGSDQFRGREPVKSSETEEHKPPSVPEATKTGDFPDGAVDSGMAEISGFDGYVMAWSFGGHPEVLRSHDFEFELKVPSLGRNVPALIGLRPMSAEVVDGKQCLLHSVVTCLARTGEVFDPPLCLRFPVGDVDSMESGSDCSSDNAEVTYRAHLESTYSALTRKNAGSEWVPIDGTIVQTDGVFVLEVHVSHFCDFALKQDIMVHPGCVEFFDLPKLKHKSRRSHYHFVNLGTENLVVHCWGVPRKRGYLESFRLKLGIGVEGGEAEMEAKRTRVDASGTVVYKVDVNCEADGEPRKGACLPVDDLVESLTVAYTTQIPVRAGAIFGNTYQLVQVWGTRHMRHKQVMVFGALSNSPLVPNLRVEDGVNAGELVRSKVPRGGV